MASAGRRLGSIGDVLHVVVAMSAIGTKRTSLVHRTCPLSGVKRTWPICTPNVCF